MASTDIPTTTTTTTTTTSPSPANKRQKSSPSPANPNSKFLQLLSAFTTQSPIFPNDWGHVTKINDLATLPQAFDLMIKNHIQALPIVSNLNGKLLAVVTIQDIIHFIISVGTESDILRLNTETLVNHSHFRELSVLSIPLTTREPVQIAGTDNNLAQVLELMVTNGAHRVIALDDQGRPVNVITQSRLLQLVQPMLDGLPIAKKTLRELGLGLQGEVISTSANASVLSAFRLMSSTKLSSVAVIDAHGALTGVISDSDIKRLGYNLRFFHLLAETCTQFVNELRIFDISRSLPPSQDPLRCTLDSTFATVVKSICFYGVHRMFVVDSEETKKPIGVVSLSDALRVLFSACQ